MAQLIIAARDQLGADVRKELFKKLTRAWEQIDIAWMQTEAAFDLAAQIGKVDDQIAVLKLYEKAVELRKTTPFANETLGMMFFENLNRRASEQQVKSILRQS